MFLILILYGIQSTFPSCSHLIEVMSFRIYLSDLSPTRPQSHNSRDNLARLSFLDHYLKLTQRKIKGELRSILTEQDDSREEQKIERRRTATKIERIPDNPIAIFFFIQI